MICEYGKCLLCEKDLFNTCPTCAHKTAGNEYTEVEVPMTNGSRMKLATCLGCKDKVFQADPQAIMQAVRNGWHKEHDQMNWSPEQRDQYWQRHGKGVLEIVHA